MTRPTRSFDEEVERAARAIHPSETSCHSAERLVDFYIHRLDEAEAEDLRSHLAACPACLAAAADARRFVASMRGLRDLPVAASRSVRRGGWLAAAAVAAVAAGLVVYQMGGHSPTDPVARWRELVVAKAPYTPGERGDGVLWRGGAAPSGEEGAFADGMKAYASGDLALAARLLEASLSSGSGHDEAPFYLGVTLLLLERPGEAHAQLERAARGTAPGTRAEATWYLALARLKSGRQDAAIELLEDLVADPAGSHRREAADLLRQMRSAPRAP